MNELNKQDKKILAKLAKKYKNTSSGQQLAKLVISSIDPDQVRNTSPGYIGSDFAKKADDEDIIRMVELKDQKATIYNSEILPIIEQINRLRKKYKLKPMDR